MDWEHNDNYLIHYGVKGQKWGERRYRNEDGTLTAEGREHYGIGKMTDTKKYLGGDNMRRGFANWREKRHAKNLEKAKEQGNERKIEKYQGKLDAQRKANKDMENYMKKSSNDRLVGQNAAAIGLGITAGVGKSALHRYRQSRARGESGVSALVETAVPFYGTYKWAKRNKAKYGKYIVWSGLEEGEDNSL